MLEAFLKNPSFLNNVRDSALNQAGYPSVLMIALLEGKMLKDASRSID